MKKINWLLAGIALALAVVLFFTFKSRTKLYDENSMLKQKIITQQEGLDNAGIAYGELQAEHEQDMAELQGHIDSSNTVITNLEVGRQEHVLRIEELESQEPVDLPPLKEIAYWKEWGGEWKGRALKAEDQLVEKDKIILATEKQRDDEIDLRLAAEAMITQYAKQVADQYTMIQNLEKQIARKNSLSKLERGFALVAVAVLSYKAFAK